MNSVIKFFFSDKFIITFLTLFSFIFNKYYSNLGVFPIDTFLHYDFGYRILNGEHPIKDYWVIYGLIVDYMQAFFFNIFGANWFAYTFHSSFFNAVITVFTYLIFRSQEIDKSNSLAFSIFFSVLAYPSSGTPFVDHHAVFFSLIGVYCYIFGVIYKKNIFWFLLPIFIALSFLTKQVPASYLAMPLLFAVIYYAYFNKNLQPIIFSILGSIFSVLLFILVLTVLKIDLSLFLYQIIYLPLEFGKVRVDSYGFSFFGFINKFKFIIAPLIVLFIFQIQSLIKNSNNFKKDNFVIFLVIFIFSFTVIFHQHLTRNQIFIYFLIPLISAFLLPIIKKKNFNKYYLVILFVVIFLVTIKYHLRFNEQRKFHELRDIDFNNAIDATKFDKSFNGLKWITPNYKENPAIEINFLKKTRNLLNNEKNKFIIISHYNFWSLILNKKTFSPSRTYTLDGISFPTRKDKFYKIYKQFFIENIVKNQISKIYLIGKDMNKKFVTEYINENCLFVSVNEKDLKIIDLDLKCLKKVTLS